MGVPNLQQSDVLEKLKMQVGLMDPEFSLHSLRGLHTPHNTSFTIPQNGNANTNQGQSLATTASQPNSFSFTPPNAPHNSKDGNSLTQYRFSAPARADFRFFFLNIIPFGRFLPLVYGTFFPTRQSRIELVDVQRSIQLLAAEQRMEFRGAIQTSQTG